MARHKLSAKAVSAFARSDGNRLSDGAGLELIKRPTGSIAWIFRYTHCGKRKNMGLGSLDNVSLAMARDLAADAKALVARCVDPITDRQVAQRRQASKNSTVASIAASAFEAHKASLKDDGKAGRWFSPVELHILPKIGGVDVAEIDQHQIEAAIRPIWHSKAATAKKAMDRLNICLKHAAALGVDVDLNAVAKARALLGQQRHTTKSHPFVPFADVPALYADLVAKPGITTLAMRLLILTGSRAGPVRQIQIDEIDFDNRIWTIPAVKMKGSKNKTADFRIPLSDEAVAVIRSAMPLARHGNLFPGVTGKGVISDATMGKWMRTNTDTGAVPHGFRTSLRTWLAEETDASHEAAETVLAHLTGTSVARAYQRSDLLAIRRDLMQKWANYCRSN